MKIDISSVNAIIFDLGGVLLNIDYSRTIVEFGKLGVPLPEKLYTQQNQAEFFDKFETGLINSEQFYDRIRLTIPHRVSDGAIQHAWNAMILDFPQSRMELLQKLSKRKRIFLLSNTNPIHINWFNKYINALFGKDTFFKLFEKVYLSHNIGLRKPNVEAFNYVIHENNLNPQQTLFIDDSIQHIKGAQNAGLQTFLVQKEHDITELL